MEGKAKYTRKIRIVKEGHRYTAERRVLFFFWEPAIFHNKIQQYYETAEACERDAISLYTKEVIKVLR